MYARLPYLLFHDSPTVHAMTWERSPSASTSIGRRQRGRGLAEWRYRRAVVAALLGDELFLSDGFADALDFKGAHVTCVQDVVLGEARESGPLRPGIRLGRDPQTRITAPEDA